MKRVLSLRIDELVRMPRADEGSARVERQEVAAEGAATPTSTTRLKSGYDQMRRGVRKSRSLSHKKAPSLASLESCLVEAVCMVSAAQSFWGISFGLTCTTVLCTVNFCSSKTSSSWSGAANVSVGF